MELFDKTVEDINASAAEPWEQVWISKGFAVFNPSEDKTAAEIMKRADKLMCENKRERKNRQKTERNFPSNGGSWFVFLNYQYFPILFPGCFIIYNVIFQIQILF